MACHITRTASADGGHASPRLDGGEEMQQDPDRVQAVAADASIRGAAGDLVTESGPSVRSPLEH